MATYRMDVEWVEETGYHLVLEAGSPEEAGREAQAMWEDGSWRDRAVEDSYRNDDSRYGVVEA